MKVDTMKVSVIILFLLFFGFVVFVYTDIEDSPYYSDNNSEDVSVTVVSRQHIAPSMFSAFSFYKEEWIITVLTQENEQVEINTSLDYWKDAMEGNKILVSRIRYISREKNTGKIFGKPSYGSYQILFITRE